MAGAPRIWEDLQYAGFSCSKNRVARLMRAHDIRGIPQRKRWRKKNSAERPVGIHNHLARDFQASAPNNKWVTGITYIETAEGWLYLSAVLDLCSSMSAVGSCVDNAAMEGFFGLLKRERVNRRIYQTRAEARAGVFDYIERFHNSRRRRRLQAATQKESLLTQLAVNTG